MSTFKKVPDRKNAIKKARKHLRQKSPCGRPPESPRNLKGSFDRSEAGKHLRIRMKMRWREVVEDTSGFHIKVSHYDVEVQYTANGADWFTARRFAVGPRQSAVEGRLALTAATNPSGTNFRYTFTAAHGLEVNDKVTIRGTKPDVYNGEFTVTTVNSTTQVTVSGGTAGTANATTLGFGQGLSEQNNWDPEKPHAVIKHVHKNFGYRYRVRAVTGGKDNPCKSAWSDWKVVGNPGADEPPAPSAVRIWDNDRNMRVQMAWAAQAATDDSDLFDDRINHFLVEISKFADFHTIYAKHRTKGNHASFRIDDADENDAFYGRVQSISADKDKSAWMPATLAGNSNPLASPDAVHVGQSVSKTKAPAIPTGVKIRFHQAEQMRDAKWLAKALWNEVVSDVDGDDIDLNHYVLEFQTSDNGTTWTEDPRRVVVPARSDTDVNSVAHYIFTHIRETAYYRARVRAVSETNTKGDWSAWTSAKTPGTGGDMSGGDGSAASDPPTPLNVTIYHKVKPKDRIHMDWDPPTESSDSEVADLDVAYYQVIIKRNASTTPTFASAYKYDKHLTATEVSFKLNDAHVHDTYYGWVRTVNHAGRKSAWIPARQIGNSDGSALAEGAKTSDGVPAGTVRKFARTPSLTDYQEADGRSASTSAYPELFAAIGYTYGGSGATFVFPDHRRRKAIGVYTTGGDAVGDNEGLAVTARLEDTTTHTDITGDGTVPTASRGRHKHNAAAGLTLSGPTTTRTISNGTGNSFDVAGVAHSHTASGEVNESQSGHTHASLDGQINSADAPTGKGHKGKPRLKVRFYVKVED